MRHFNIGKLSQPDWPVKRNKQQGWTNMQGKELVSATKKLSEILTITRLLYFRYIHIVFNRHFAKIPPKLE